MCVDVWECYKWALKRDSLETQVCALVCVCLRERKRGRESLFQNTLLSCPGWVSRYVSCITMRRFTAEEKPTQNTNTHKHTRFLWFRLFLYLSLSSIKPHTFSVCISPPLSLPKGVSSLLQLLSTCFYNFQYLLPTPLMSYSSISCKADSELYIYSDISTHHTIKPDTMLVNQQKLLLLFVRQLLFMYELNDFKIIVAVLPQPPNGMEKHYFFKIIKYCQLTSTF